MSPLLSLKVQHYAVYEAGSSEWNPSRTGVILRVFTLTVADYSNENYVLMELMF